MGCGYRGTNVENEGQLVGAFFATAEKPEFTPHQVFAMTESLDEIYANFATLSFSSRTDHKTKR
jgi:hypothetical protein